MALRRSGPLNVGRRSIDQIPYAARAAVRTASAVERRLALLESLTDYDAANQLATLAEAIAVRDARRPMVVVLDQMCAFLAAGDRSVNDALNRFALPA